MTAAQTSLACSSRISSEHQRDVIFNQGTVSVSFKGKVPAPPQDPRFATALLKVWLGAHPAQESLKSALPGQPPTSN